MLFFGDISAAGNGAGEVAGLRRMGFERRVSILFKVGEKRVEILRILYGGQKIEPVLEKLLGN